MQENNLLLVGNTFRVVDDYLFIFLIMAPISRGYFVVIN